MTSLNSDLGHLGGHLTGGKPLPLNLLEHILKQIKGRKGQYRPDAKGGIEGWVYEVTVPGVPHRRMWAVVRDNGTLVTIRDPAKGC